MSSVVTRTRGRNEVAIRTHTLQKFEEVTARGKDKGRVFGDDGLVGLHRPCEFIERHRLGTLVVSPRVDFGGLCVRHAADSQPSGDGTDCPIASLTIWVEGMTQFYAKAEDEERFLQSSITRQPIMVQGLTTEGKLRPFSGTVQTVEKGQTQYPDYPLRITMK